MHYSLFVVVVLAHPCNTLKYKWCCHFFNIAIGKEKLLFTFTYTLMHCKLWCWISNTELLIAFSSVVSFWPIHPTSTGQWQWIRQLLYLSSHLRPLVYISTQHKAVYTTICCVTDIAIWLHSNISYISPSLFFEWSCCFLSKVWSPIYVAVHAAIKN